VRLCYAENWVYAPPIQRARRLLTAAGGPILRIVGEESHGGTHAPINKRWETGGGGSLIGKGCHPLGAALYLKADEGRRLRGRPVRPRAVMAETAQLTATDVFTAAGRRFLNTVAGADVEDWGTLLLTFDDGTVAQITGGDTVLGGIWNQLGIYAARATSRRASSRGSTRARTRSRRAAVPGLVRSMRRLGGRADRADGTAWREELTGLGSLRP
jgi:predicted dehydrogenase